MNKTALLLPLLLVGTSLAFADSSINLTSETGDYIGQGHTCSYNDTNADITYARNYDNGISVTIHNQPDDPYMSWRLDLAAPGNAEIVPGEYNDAERFPFQSVENPGLSFTGNGRGCNKLTGSFKVYEVVYDGSGDVTALSASFEQYCDASNSALIGDIVFNTVPPVGATAIGMAAYHAVCKNRTTGQKVVHRVESGIVDCRKLGLNINPGDDIQLRIRGVAEQ